MIHTTITILYLLYVISIILKPLRYDNSNNINVLQLLRYTQLLLVLRYEKCSHFEQTVIAERKRTVVLYDKYV